MLARSDARVSPARANGIEIAAARIRRPCNIKPESAS